MREGSFPWRCTVDSGGAHRRFGSCQMIQNLSGRAEVVSCALPPATFVQNSRCRLRDVRLLSPFLSFLLQKPRVPKVRVAVDVEEIISRFLRSGHGAPSEVLGAILREAPLPVEFLIGTEATCADDSAPEGLWRRLAELLREASCVAALGHKDRSRLELTAVRPLVLLHEISTATDVYYRATGVIKDDFPHLARRMASHLAVAFAGAGEHKKAGVFLEDALDGGPETAPIGLYVRCWRAIRKVGSVASLKTVLLRHLDHLAEAWLYLRLTSHVVRADAKGHEDWLLSSPRPEDKVAAGLLLAELAPGRHAILRLTALWLRDNQDIGTQIDAALVLPLPSSAMAERAVTMGGVARASPLDDVRARLKVWQAAEARAICDAFANDSDEANRVEALILKADAERRTMGHEAAWLTVEDACRDVRKLDEPRLEAAAELQRAWIALNTLRPWGALVSARRACCLYAIAGDVDNILSTLAQELEIVESVGASYRSKHVRYAFALLERTTRARTLTMPREPWPTEGIREMLDRSKEWEHDAAALARCGEVLYSAQAYSEAARRMIDTGKRSWRTLSRDWALREASSLAEKVGAQRLLLRILNQQAATATTLPDEARAALLQHLTTWRKCLDQIPIARERGGAIAALEETVVRMLQRSGGQLRDVDTNADLWWAAGLVKFRFLVDHDGPSSSISASSWMMSDRKPIERAVAAHFRSVSAIGLESYVWGHTATWFVVRGMDSESRPLDVRRVDVPRRHGRELSVPDAVRRAFDGARVVYIAPHGPFHDVAAHALPCVPSGELLGDKVQVFTVPRLTDLGADRSVTHAKSDGVWAYIDMHDEALWFGGAEKLNAQLGYAMVAASGKEPVEELLRQSSGYRQILWFCHGGWVREGVQREFLDLSAGRRLTLASLRASGVRFDGSEVLLMACQRRPIEFVGSRLSSLALGFYELGASVVIGCLGPVEDSQVAAELAMEYVVKRWEGRTSGDAWAKAREAARRTANSDMRAWGRFVAYGRSDV